MVYPMVRVSPPQMGAVDESCLEGSSPVSRETTREEIFPAEALRSLVVFVPM